MAGDLSELQTQHSQTLAKLDDYKRKHLELGHRLLKVRPWHLFCIRFFFGFFSFYFIYLDLDVGFVSSGSFARTVFAMVYGLFIYLSKIGQLLQSWPIKRAAFELFCFTFLSVWTSIFSLFKFNFVSLFVCT